MQFAPKAHDIIFYNTYWFLLFVVIYISSHRIYIKMHFSLVILLYLCWNKTPNIFVIIYLYSYVFVYYLLRWISTYLLPVSHFNHIKILSSDQMGNFTTLVFTYK